MTRDQELIIKPAAAIGYLIFAAAIAVNPVLWPLGTLIALNVVRENCK
jgi:hypothetical protein